jgi:hypothetical protein
MFDLFSERARPGRPATRSTGRLLAVLLALTSLLLPARAHTVAEEMAGAAQNFLAALSPELKARVAFSLTDAERQNWHFIPRDRNGVALKELTPAQRHLAFGLLSSGLSHRGYLKATTIMSLEEILKEIEQGRGPLRDPERYFVTVFGEPGEKSVWGWRFEGHHLSLNFTLANGEVTCTPAMLGTNPAEVRSGPRSGLRVLAREEDLGRALVRSLNETQRRAAVISTTAPPDVISVPGQRAKLLEPPGLPAGQLDPGQRAMLQRLVTEYVQWCRTELAAADLARIEAAGWDQLRFAWAGSIEPGQGSYYRVQGPSFILEFDNTQNHANHIHAVWRDFGNDFGEDLLKRHYDQSPHGR